MDEDYFRRSHVPPFGSWDCTDDLPFTQCFETARHAGLLRYSYSQDRDLYVAGDLYQNDVVTPAMIVVPRRRTKKRNPNGKEEKGGRGVGKKEKWVVCEVKQPPSPVPSTPSPIPIPPPKLRKTPKAVDEDLYKISPDLLHAKPRRKRIGGFFFCCSLPRCD